MTTLTLPDVLLRHAIGLENLNRFAHSVNGTNYPPHNIEQTGDDSYTLTLAVAGFIKDEITISLHRNVLLVAGAKLTNDDADRFIRLASVKSLRNRRLGQLLNKEAVQPIDVVVGAGELLTH